MYSEHLEKDGKTHVRKSMGLLSCGYPAARDGVFSKYPSFPRSSDVLELVLYDFWVNSKMYTFTS